MIITMIVSLVIVMTVVLQIGEFEVLVLDLLYDFVIHVFSVGTNQDRKSSSEFVDGLYYSNEI